MEEVLNLLVKEIKKELDYLKQWNSTINPPDRYDDWSDRYNGEYRIEKRPDGYYKEEQDFRIDEISGGSVEDIPSWYIPVYDTWTYEQYEKYLQEYLNNYNNL